MTEHYFDHHLTEVERFVQKTLSNMDTYVDKVGARFDVVRDLLSLLYAHYSRGYAIPELKKDMVKLVEAWEELRVADADNLYTNSFKNDLTNYVESLGLVAVAGLLGCDESLTTRLLACIRNPGQDLLFERLTGRLTSLEGRPEAQKLMYPKAYQLLYDSIDAPAAERATLVKQFLQHWYQRIKAVGWHGAHKGPEGGGFKGYWCWEAAGVAYAFGIDDSSFRDMPYYPQDLADFARATPRT